MSVLISYRTRWSEWNIKLVPKFKVQGMYGFRDLPHGKHFLPSVTEM